MPSENDIQEFIAASKKRLDSFVALKHKLDNTYIFSATNPGSYFSGAIARGVFQAKKCENMRKLSMKLSFDNKMAAQTLELLQKHLSEKQK